MRIGLLVICTLLAASTSAFSAEELRPIGLVKVAAGDVAILRNTQRIAAQPGQQLYQKDILSTGPTGRISIILRDDTILALGSSSELHIDRFVFEPSRQNMGMVLRVTRGIIGYRSGRIAKLAPEAVRIETPKASLGIKGTYLMMRVVP
ncbi:FecR family protein [Geomobilimonas luticola]|uniref:FecR domain-containing protein n=1 Tax=Geomobilimonas luticola TaxID=1114878 RepID=A0ABS5SBP8_9BACT|nr:FecR domain-containing protein [Geomobilimonas luticola]MBT0652793.1 FecR domain-containing protein [Geomobilimonas luticola]